MFGVTSAFSLFMSTLNNIFSEFDEKLMIIYLGDIFVYSTTWSEHIIHITNTLKRLWEEKFYGKLKNCVFEVEEVEYLGFKLCNNKLLVNHSNLQAVQAR